MAGGGGDAPPHPVNGGEFLLSLLQKHQNDQPQTPVQQPSSSSLLPFRGSPLIPLPLPLQQQQQPPPQQLQQSLNLDPAVAAVGPTIPLPPPWQSNGRDLPLPPTPWPHSLSPPFPPNFQGFPQNQWSPVNQFPGNQGVNGDDLGRILGFPGVDVRENSNYPIHNVVQQKQQEPRLVFGSFRGDIHIPGGLSNGNSVDSSKFSTAQDRELGIGSKHYNRLDSNHQFDSRVNSNQNAIRQGDFDSRQQERILGETGKQQYTGNFRPSLSPETLRPPPGFSSKPRGGGDFRTGLGNSVNKSRSDYRELNDRGSVPWNYDNNVRSLSAEEGRFRVRGGNLRRGQEDSVSKNRDNYRNLSDYRNAHCNNDDHRVRSLNTEDGRSRGHGSNQRGFGAQLDHPGPPAGSHLHSASALDIEESLSNLHIRSGEARGGHKYSGQRKSRKEDGSSCSRVSSELEQDDLDEQLVDSLLLDDESEEKSDKKQHRNSRDKEYRSDNRGQRTLSQRIRNQKRLMECRSDIGRLNASFIAIYESLIPPEEEKVKQKQLLTLLEKLVSREWPQARLYLYGSCANSFGVSKSDIDVCLAIEDTELDKSEILLKLADILQSDNLQNVQALTRARVPIVKLMDPVTEISCDICINNVLAVVNTKLLWDYAEIDGRLRQLAFIVKHWAKSRGVNETYQGTLSSYAEPYRAMHELLENLKSSNLAVKPFFETCNDDCYQVLDLIDIKSKQRYVLMCIHFLQQRRPPILPCLQEMETTYSVTVEDIRCAFFDQVEKLRGFGSRNKESVAQLVWAFFNYWAYCHDYANDVISVRTGCIISKREKDWTRRIGNDRHLICIEDPFEISHDLGRVVDKYSIKVLREEFERAADIMQYDPNPCITLFQPYIPG